MIKETTTTRLTAKNWDQLRDPTLGNRVWATFSFLPPAFGGDPGGISLRSLASEHENPWAIV